MAKKVITARFDENLVKDIDALASAEGRSFSNFLEKIVREYLQEQHELAAITEERDKAEANRLQLTSHKEVKAQWPKTRTNV